jgi:hypothetical protein
VKDDPWWVSLSHPVQNDESTCLSYLLGLKHSVGIEFLCSAGFLKVGHSRNANAIVVVAAEWDMFLVEEKLTDILEPVNRTVVGGQRHYFINIGSKKELSHPPIHQFNGKIANRPNFGTYLAVRQRKLRKSLSDMCLSLRVYDESHRVITSKEVIIEDMAQEYDSEDNMMEDGDETTPPSIVWKEETVFILLKLSLRTVPRATLMPFSAKFLPFLETALVLILRIGMIKGAVPL